MKEDVAAVAAMDFGLMGLRVETETETVCVCVCVCVCVGEGVGLYLVKKVEYFYQG